MYAGTEEFDRNFRAQKKSRQTSNKQGSRKCENEILLLVLSTSRQIICCSDKNFSFK